MAIRYYSSLRSLSKVPKTWNCVPMSQLWIPGLVKSVDRNVTENSKAAPDTDLNLSISSQMAQCNEVNRGSAG